MSAEENNSIQLTQSTLGKYVTKPNLSEKLLKKPPFRFLHDIVCVIINDTGYLKGLFTDEQLVSANVKEREAKVLFLNKLITAVKATTNSDLKIRASKIIAGLEPIETNKLLQTIAKAIEQKIDSSDYVKSLSGTPKEKVAKASRTSTHRDKIKETKAVSKTTRTSDNSKSNVKTTPKEKSTSKESQSSNRSNSKTTVPEKKVRDKKTIEKKSSRDAIPSTDRKERKHDESKPKKEGKVSTKVSPKETDEKPSKTIETIAEDKILVSQELQKTTDMSNNRTNDENLLHPTSDDKETNHVKVNETVDTKPVFERPKTAKISKSMTQLMKDNSQNVLNNQDSVETPEEQPTQTPQVISNSNTSEPSAAKPPVVVPAVRPHNRPRSSLRPPSARPGTARPAAPRLRPPSALPPSDIVVANGNVKVVVEQYKIGKGGEVEDDDDEETVVIQENLEDLSSTISNTLDTSATVDAAASKSHLVGQIMAQVGQQDDQAGTRGKPAAVQVQLFQSDKPVAELGASIQTVTQSANTLGQLMGYLHEDIDAMRAELEHWSQVARATIAAADKRRTELTERTRPLQAKLQEVEDEIQRQKEEVATLQCTIYSDQGRIESLLRREVAGVSNGGAVPIYE